MKAKIEKELDYLLEGNYLINNSKKVQFIGNVLKICEDQNKELIEALEDEKARTKLLASRYEDLQDKKLAKENKNQFENMQYYLEYCLNNEYVTPQVWIEIHKHF